MTTILSTHDYREAIEIIQKEAIPNKYSWTVTYDNDNNEYLVTINKAPDRCIFKTFSDKEAFTKAVECNRSYLGSWKLEYNYRTHLYAISISEEEKSNDNTNTKAN